MRALLVVIVAPAREEHSRFAERVYQLAVQALLPEAAIEALCVPVLPGASGVDVEGLDPVFFELSLDRLGDELGAVARAVDPEPPANGSPGTGQRGLVLRRDTAPPLRAQRFFPGRSPGPWT